MENLSPHKLKKAKKAKDLHLGSHENLESIPSKLTSCMFFPQHSPRIIGVDDKENPWNLRSLKKNVVGPMVIQEN